MQLSKVGEDDADDSEQKESSLKDSITAKEGERKAVEFKIAQVEELMNERGPWRTTYNMDAWHTTYNMDAWNATYNVNTRHTARRHVCAVPPRRGAGGRGFVAAIDSV